MRTLIILSKEGEDPAIVEQGKRRSCVGRLQAEGFKAVATVNTDLNEVEFRKLLELKFVKRIGDLETKLTDINKVLRRA